MRGFVVIAILWFVTVSASVALAGPSALGSRDDSLPSVPPGFLIQPFASGLGAPRAMALDPRGNLVVSIPSTGRIVALPARPGRAVADRVVVTADNLDRPHGLAFVRGRLYVAETGRVLSFAYDLAALTASDPVVLIRDLPAGAHHWSRTIAAGPDGDLYVAIGSSCDICRERDPRRAAIVRYAADGSRERVFATGLRNPVGLAFHPGTGALWTTVNERDWPGGDAPPDYVTAIQAGGAYGWPDCFARHRAFAPDPGLHAGEGCRGLTLPTLELPPHSAPLGLAFYTGTRFPAAFRGSLFVALHGSRPGLPPAGYKIIRVSLEAGRVGGVEDFSTGWRQGGRIVGRPVDVIVGRDGSLYVSDDYAGHIYRITFVGNSRTSQEVLAGRP